MTDRQLLAVGLDLAGFDDPSIRRVCRGTTLETWHRACDCAGECGHWEHVGSRPATPDEVSMFKLAARRYPAKTAPVADEGAVNRLAAEWQERHERRVNTERSRGI